VKAVKKNTDPKPAASETTTVIVADPNVDCASETCSRRSLSVIEGRELQGELISGKTNYIVVVEVPGKVDEESVIDTIISAEEEIKDVLETAGATLTTEISVVIVPATPSPTPGPTATPSASPSGSFIPSALPSDYPSIATPIDSPTENPPVSCTDNERKIFEIDLDGNGDIKKDGTCAWLASNKPSKRKTFCATKVIVRLNPAKKLSAICKETCGLVGFGKCAPDCEDKSKKFEIAVDEDETETKTKTKRKGCDWVASKRKSRRRELCTNEVLFKGKMRKLPEICIKTCGEFGKGKCMFNP